MFLLVLAVLVAAVVLGAPVLAAALDVRLGAVVAGAAAVVIVVLVLLAVVGVGLRGEGEHEPERGSPATTTTSAPAAVVRDPDIVVGFEDGGFPQPPPVLDGLRDGDAPLVELRGLLANARGTIRQCGTTCRPAIPLLTDDGGVTQVVVPVAEEGGDRLVVDVDNVGPTIDLVFGAAADRPAVIVEPRRARVGERVEVAVEGVPRDAGLEVALCDNTACSPGAPVHDGRATLEVGSVCRRGEPCAVVVLDGDVAVADAVPLRVLGAPGVDENGRRLAAGLGAAALLAALAWWLASTTDWRQMGLPSTTDDA